MFIYIIFEQFLMCFNINYDILKKLEFLVFPIHMYSDSIKETQWIHLLGYKISSEDRLNILWILTIRDT